MIWRNVVSSVAGCLLAVAMIRAGAAAEPVVGQAGKSGASWWSSAPAVAIGPATIDVRRQGALGDGRHDDTAAIQAAIDALPPGGGTVLIPPGNYMIDALKSVNLRSHVRLQLADEARLTAIPNAAPRYYIVRVARVNDVEIAGGRIVGDRAGHRGSTGEWGYGLNIAGSRNVVVRNVYVSDCWGDGFGVGAVGRRGPEVVVSRDVRLEQVVSTNNRRQGLSIFPVERLAIVNCIFSDTHGTKPSAGIDIEPQEQGTSRDIRIEQTTLSGNQGSGLEVRDHVAGLVVTRCTIKDNHGYGVYTDSPRDGSITANTIDGNGLKGVAFHRTTQGFRLSGNTITGNSARYFQSRGVPVKTRSRATSGTVSAPSRDLEVMPTTRDIIVSDNQYTP